jgi:hypothetical protein
MSLTSPRFLIELLVPEIVKPAGLKPAAVGTAAFGCDDSQSGGGLDNLGSLDVSHQSTHDRSQNMAEL